MEQEFELIPGLSGLGFGTVSVSETEYCPSNAWLGILLIV